MSRQQALAIVSLIPQLPSPKTENFPGEYPSTEEAEYHESFDMLKKGEEQKLDTRHLVFDSQKTKHEIGRASSNPTKGVNAATDNGYFKAPVMSRRHAELDMCEQTKRIVITDTASMHGTLINGKNLKAYKCHQLRHGDIISFGTEVARDGAVHRPKVFKVLIEWKDLSPPTPETPDQHQHQSNKIKALPFGYGVSGDDLIVSDGEPGDSIDPESNYIMQYSEDEFSAEENSDYPSSEIGADEDNHSLHDSNDEMDQLYDEDDTEEQTIVHETLRINNNNNKVSIDNLMNNGTAPTQNETSTVSVHNYTKSVTREFEQKSVPTPHQGFYQPPGPDSFWRNVLDNSEQRGVNQSTGGHTHKNGHIIKATTSASVEHLEQSLDAKLAKLRQHHASMGYPKLQANQTANHTSTGISTPVLAINDDVHDESPVVAAEKIRANISKLIADKEKVPSATQHIFDSLANEPRYIKPLHLMSPPTLSPENSRAATVVEPIKSRCSINDLVHQTPAQNGASKSHCPITPASLAKPTTEMEIDSSSRGRKRGHDEYEEDAATEKDAMSDAGSDAESTSTRPDQTKFLSQSFRGLDVVDEDETQCADEPKAATTTTSTTAVSERPIKRARVWPQVTAGFALGTLTGAVGLFAALVASAPPA